LPGIPPSSRPFESPAAARPVLPAFFIAVNRFQRADRHPPNTLWNGVQVYWALLIVYCRRGNGDEQEERLKARFRFSAPIISMQPRRGCRRSKPLRRQLRLCPKGSHPLPRQPGFSPIQAGRRRKARCRLSEMRKATVPTPSWTRTSSRSLGPLLPTAVNQKKDSSSLLSYRGENFPPHPRSENDWGLPWQNRRIFLVLVLEGSVNFLLKRPLFIGAP